MSKTTSIEESNVKQQRTDSNSLPSENDSSSTDSHDDEQTNAALPLNYDCWWKIFNYCDINTLCYLENVCKEFQTVAEDVFRRQFTTFETSGYNRTTFRRVLCKFGHLIRSIAASCDNANNISEIDVGDVNKCCPNLEHLQLQYLKTRCKSSISLFKHLRTLKIKSCRLGKSAKKLLKNCLELEDLHVTGENIKDILHCFPKLKTFTYKPELYRFRNKWLNKFLELNSNLTELYGDFLLYDEFSLNIVKHTPNLEVLDLSHSYNLLRLRQSTEGLLQLINLKRLRQLSLSGSETGCSVMKLMEAFSNANIPIENLSLNGFKIGPVKNICNLKSIHTLCLLRLIDFNESELISLLTQLPLLKKLEISLARSTNVTDELFDAIRDSNTCINELTIKHFEINSTIIWTISTIKSLNVLRLQNLLVNPKDRISESDLISLVTEMPLITEIEVGCQNRNGISITVDGLKKMVEGGKRLKHIKFQGIEGLHINESAFETILNAVPIDTGVLVYFIGCKHQTSFFVRNDYCTFEARKFKSADNRLEMRYTQNGCICNVSVVNEDQM